MLKNGSEMYNNINLGENASRYCNGYEQMATGSKKVIKSRNGKMVPNKEELPLPGSPSLSVDNKLKFSDRLKALLKTGASLTDDGMETDDPYAFCEPEPQVFRLYQNNSTPNNTYSRKCMPVGQTTPKSTVKTAVDTIVVPNGQASVNEHNNITRLYPALSASLGHSLPINPPQNLPSGTKGADDDSSKTMNRLQAKIARNKVIGKHKKVRPSSRNLNFSHPLTKNIKKERSLLEEQLLGIKTEFCVKKEPEETGRKSYKSQQQHSMSHLVMTTIPTKRRRSMMMSRHNATPWHEALQRIRQAGESVRDFHQDLYPLGVDVSESEDSEGEGEVGIFQKHWFSGWPEQSEGHHRDGRLCLARTEMRRKLSQVSVGVTRSHDNTRDNLTHSIIETARMHPSQVAMYLQSETKRCRVAHVKQNRSKAALLYKRVCCFKKGEDDACTSLALPCTQHCLRHIMYNVDQLLFEYCTAKFSDNTQCCEPVFDICHELPLCIEHARKRDNYDKMCAEIKPKKVRKKPKPSAMTRPNKRGKKRRKVPKIIETVITPAATRTAFKSLQPHHNTTFAEMDIDNFNVDNNFDMYIKEEIVESLTDPEIHVIMKNEPPVVEGVEEVLAMAGLPLDPVELATQASRLLEEHDLTNVLNQIPADAFNDLFTEDKNGAYEPTREETEELERALEAVDKDVKSLEKLSQTQGLLETLMDDHNLVHTLSQIPEVPLTVPGIVPVFTSYHNGFIVNNSSIASHSRKCVEPSILNSTLLSPNISIQTQTNLPS